MPKYHDNAHAPPSHNTMHMIKTRAMREKKNQEDGAAAPDRGGRSTGHSGVSHGIKPTGTAGYQSDACGGCDKRDGLVVTRTGTKMHLDFKSDPGIEGILQATRGITFQSGYTAMGDGDTPRSGRFHVYADRGTRASPARTPAYTPSSPRKSQRVAISPAEYGRNSRDERRGPQWRT